MAETNHEFPGPTEQDLQEALERIAPGGTPFSDALRVERGFRLEDADASSTPAFDGDKADGQLAMVAAEPELDELQERLYAMGTRGDRRRLLVIVQGMDTAGKGGVMRHVFGTMDPQGVQIAAFKAPTAEERKHDFLWRIRQQLPDAGHIGVFDRSHYEDVLVVRVHDLVAPEQWKKRYAAINAFERQMAARGTTVVKVMLHVSRQEQSARLLERLERPEKHWKFNPGDLDEREFWEDYQEAYQVVLSRTSTKGAPWYVVPADRKWYARLAVQQLVLEHLRAMDLTWPEADFDVEANLERLREQIIAAPEGAEDEPAFSEAPEVLLGRTTDETVEGAADDSGKKKSKDTKKSGKKSKKHKKKHDEDGKSAKDKSKKKSKHDKKADKKSAKKKHDDADDKGKKKSKDKKKRKKKES